MPFPYDFTFPFDGDGEVYHLIAYTEPYYDLVVFTSEVEQ